MENSTKLLLGSIVALLLGLLLAAPLVYTNIVIAPDASTYLTLVTAIAMTMFLLGGLSLRRKANIEQ